MRKAIGRFFFPLLRQFRSSLRAGVPLGHLAGLDVSLVMCGSFNPIQLGHVRAMEDGRNYLLGQCRCHQVEVIVSPVADAYKKEDLLPAFHRIAMIELAVADKREWVRVDDSECRCDEWRRTLLVLDDYQLALQPAGRRVVMLCGSDLANSFNERTASGSAMPADAVKRWEEARLSSGDHLWDPHSDVREIIDRYGIIVKNRAGRQALQQDHLRQIASLTERFAHNVAIIGNDAAHGEARSDDISSTAVRECLRLGMPVDHLIHPAVLHYIRVNRLFEESGANKSS